MNFIKRLLVFVAFALSVSYLFADKQIGIITDFVKNESHILGVGIADDNVPVFVVREERDGYVSTVAECFVIYGKEKVGPFDSVDGYTFSPDGKTISYLAIIDRKVYKNIFFNSQVYTGSICGDKVVYIKDGKIMLKE